MGKIKSSADVKEPIILCAVGLIGESENKEFKKAKTIFSQIFNVKKPKTS